MRLIDGDELIERWAFGMYDTDDGTIRQVVAVKAIEDMPNIAPRDWTPCDDGLPAEDGEYWVTFMYHGAPFVDKRTFHSRTGIWAKTTNVTAWMTKPTPYNPDHIVDTNKKMED